MSLSTDLLAALEVVVRAAVPSIPAGALGVTDHWIPAPSLSAENYPHAVFWAPTEKPVTLPYRQHRVELVWRIAIIRASDDLASSLDDYNAIRSGLEADTTLGGLVDLTELTLEAVQDSEPESPFRATVLAVAAFVEL